MGIRFNSGAIPVAVIPMCIAHYVFRTQMSHCPARRDGKASESRVSQKTCHFQVTSLSIRVKGWRGISAFNSLIYPWRLFVFPAVIKALQPVSGSGPPETGLIGEENRSKRIVMAEQQKHNSTPVYIIVIIITAIFCAAEVSFCQNKDTTTITLDKVEVSDQRNPRGYKTSIPSQTLSNDILAHINTLSVGEAARYFSGVLVKDYGGVGGLKTVSVRSLGAVNTGIIYDGVPVTDIQTGQIDLSRFTGFLMQSVHLFLANPPELPAPARSFALPSVLAINTYTFEPVNFSKAKWQASTQTGSFGLWQPHAGIYLPVGNGMIVSAQAEATFSKGDYPYRVENGNFSEQLRRTNSNVKSLLGEANVVKLFKDSSLLQFKMRSYISERGLPGAIIFFNTRSVQKLWNRDVFLQGRYRRDLNKMTSLLLCAKYSHAYTRYTDPDFQNGAGGLDDRYNQDEYYISASLSRQISKRLTGAVATDISQNDLSANTNNFVKPKRLGIWNSLALKYISGPIQLSGSLLNTRFHDKTRLATSTIKHNKLTPTASVSVIPKENSPFLFRFFFKEAYRMPTFNDLYYNFIGNRNLNPETSYQYNLGITWSKANIGKITRINISADGYFNKIKDKIVAVPNQNLFNWTMLNLGKVNIKGVDLNAEMNLNFSPELHWLSRIAYTFQRALDVTNPAGASYKNTIPYTPDHSCSALTIFSYQKWSASYSLLFSAQRYTLGANDPTNLLGGWTTHDFAVIRIIRFHLFETDLKAGINNALNNRYEVVRYFPMPGRNFLFSIIFKNL